MLCLAIFVLSGLNDSRKQNDFVENTFALADTSNLNRLVIEKDGKVVSYFQKLPNGAFKLNDSIAVDAQMTEILLKVFSKIKIKREAPASRADSIKSELEKSGYKISFYNQAQEIIKSFYINKYKGNPEFAQAFYPNDEVPYLVNVPGFQNNIVDLISLNALDWKDRIVFNSNWRSILEVEIEYFKNANASFLLKYKNGFFDLNNSAKPDTAKVVNYLNSYSQFRIGAYLDAKENILTDSLKLTKPFCRIRIIDIDQKNSNSLIIYPYQKNDALIYGKNERNGEFFMVPRSIVAELLASKDSFL